MSTLVSLVAKNDIIFFYALNKKLNCKPLNTIMKGVTEFGSTPFAIISSILMLFYNSSIGIILIINLLASQAVIQLLKRIVNRPRPYKSLEWVISIKPPKCKYSLPSGHSSSALTIALVFSTFIPGLRLLLLSLALIVGVSRVYLGCHYPTDVSIGFLVSFLIYKILSSMVFI